MLPEISRRCLSCGAAVRAGSRFCQQCGKALEGSSDSSGAPEERSAEAARVPAPTTGEWAQPSVEEAAPRAEEWAPPTKEFAAFEQPPVVAEAAATEQVLDAAPDVSEGAEPEADAPVARESREEAPDASAEEAERAGDLRGRVARVREGTRARVGRTREKAIVVLEETPDDSGLRFVLAAAALFVFVVVLLFLSTTVLR